MLGKVLSKIPIGRRQAQQIQQWIPSATLFGAGAAALGLYLTDWKVIVQYIPFYSGKFKTDE